MLSSENVQSARLVIDVDPGSTGDFHLMRAPRAITVKAAYVVAKAAQNAGTAVLLTLANWGTAGTATTGTVVAAVGGTASAARLAAQTPTAGTVDTAEDNIAAGEWLVVQYTEEGAGWVSGDRFTYQVDYVIGQA